MADTMDSKSITERCEGSSPSFRTNIFRNATVTQLVECMPEEHMVTGSSPVGCTKLERNHSKTCLCARSSFG